jgi:hypothetical protein
METVDVRYSVSLRDHSDDLRAGDRVKIETRYAAELERAFGMEWLESSPPDVLTEGDLSLVKQWSKASAAARQAALREVGDADGWHFEVERVPF